jgi:hypothetical protein
MKENNENTIKRLNVLSKSLKIDMKWECEVRRELKEDKEMKEFFNDNGNEKGPINPRSAYFGGRTGYAYHNIFIIYTIFSPLCLYEKSDEKKTISMLDIISLYPFVNYSTR